MKKQGIKSFFKPVSTNSNVAKETDPVEKTTSVEVPSKSSRSKETEIVNEKPNQPGSTFVFPKTAFAKQNQSCQAQWFVEYKWLDYKVNYNFTCFICKKHLKKLDQKKNKEDAFLRTKFRNWKKAITSFRDHQQSKCHLAALTFEVTVPQCLHVIAFANLYTKSKDNRKRMFGKFTKKTCKITMTNFLLSFSLYLVS